jgi:hypothetical protein
MAGKRPPHVKAPAYLTPNTPVPEPRAPDLAPDPGGRDGLNPTRYGDWVSKGIAVDF